MTLSYDTLLFLLKSMQMHVAVKMLTLSCRTN